MFRTVVIPALVVVCAWASACGRESAPAGQKEDPAAAKLAAARTIAKEAYVYGVPMVDTYKVMHAFSVDKANPQYKGPLNTLLNVGRVFTPADTAFVTPNSDTPYTFIGLDLRAEPMVLTIPKMETNRYFVFQLMDLYTFNFDYIGTRATGNGGGAYMIAGPGWQGDTPAGITKVIRSETQLVSGVGRTQLFNTADLANVKKIQAGYKLEPLSTFLKTAPPPAAPAVQYIKPLGSGDDVKTLEFFNQLAFLLQFAQPPHPSEVELRKRFETIGIIPGQPFVHSSLTPEMQAALKGGMEDGQKDIDARRASLGGRTDRLFGTREFLKNDYVARATGTQVGIGANSREEAIYPFYETDSTGQELDGSRHRYTLRFEKDKLPPVNAFWSLTMYDSPRQLLVKNPLNRYLINSPMLPRMKTDADGGLTIYIQADSPGKALESNWLPAPKGKFMMAMRYYLPKQELLDGQWTSPPVQRID